MGTVRPAPACRPPRCSAPMSATRASWYRRANPRRHHPGRRGLSRPGHRPRRRRQHHRQVERLYRPRSDERPASYSAMPTNVGLPLAFIAHQSFNVLTKYQVPDDISRSAARRPTARKSTAERCSPRIRARCCRATGASTPSSSGKVTKNWEWKLFANNIFNKTLLRCLLSERGAVRARRAGSRSRRGIAAKF